MRVIVSRLLTDRFWQAGISEGSKDDFYARVLEKKFTMEGFASTVRGAIRFVREATGQETAVVPLGKVVVGG